LTKKFLNKYRIESSRLQNWDYGWKGFYFITIYTGNRIHYFGEIVDGGMVLSDPGRVVERLWLKIPEQFHYILLDEFVIMPDHIHGILQIIKNNPGGIKNPGGAANDTARDANDTARDANDTARDDSDPEYMLGVDYGKMTPVLLQAIKEQQETIENQQSEIDELKKMVYELMEKNE